MDEFTFINSIKQQYYRQSSLVKGIGDDAAVFRQSNTDIVTAVDTFVEDVHFKKSTMSAFHIGYRILAANISDLAAMGSTPAFYLVSIVIPKSWTHLEVSDIFKGMKKIASYYKMDLIGGDTVFGKEMTISVTVIGYAEKRVRYRSDAKDGDIVFVTGTLGDSQAGYHILTNPANYQEDQYYIARHRMPTPRVEFATGLSKDVRVALNDVSDGIASEAAEIAVASNVSILIHDDKVPVRDSYKQFPEHSQYQWKYFGGEDFELIGTVAKQNWKHIVLLANQLGLRLTSIGEVFLEDNNHVYLKKNNKVKILPKQGYNHLK